MQSVQQYIMEAFESKIISRMFNKGNEETKAFIKGHNDWGHAISKLDPIVIKGHILTGEVKRDFEILKKYVKLDDYSSGIDVMVVKNNNLIARIRYYKNKRMSSRILDNNSGEKSIKEILKLGSICALPVILKTRQDIKKEKNAPIEKRQKRFRPWEVPDHMVEKHENFDTKEKQLEFAKEIKKIPKDLTVTAGKYAFTDKDWTKRKSNLSEVLKYIKPIGKIFNQDLVFHELPESSFFYMQDKNISKRPDSEFPKKDDFYGVFKTQKGESTIFLDKKESKIAIQSILKNILKNAHIETSPIFRGLIKKYL